MQSTWPSLLAFLFVLALFPLAAWLLRRGQPLRIGGGAALDVASAVAVGARERIALVRADQTWLVVGITAQSITLLARLDQAPAGLDAGTGSPASGTFAAALRSLRRHADPR